MFDKSYLFLYNTNVKCNIISVYLLSKSHRPADHLSLPVGKRRFRPGRYMESKEKADHFLISYKKIRVVYNILYTNRSIYLNTRGIKIKNYCYNVYIQKFSSLRRYICIKIFIFFKRKSLVLIHVLVYLGLLDIY